MSRFRLSKRSRNNLVGVRPELIEVVSLAIEITQVDFGVIEGVRTLERQKELVAAGASQTLNSRHLDGSAIDVMAYIGSRGSWELYLYPTIADAFKVASEQTGVPIRWGGAWTEFPIAEALGDMEEAMYRYSDKRRSVGRRPFIDAGHFELL